MRYEALLAFFTIVQEGSFSAAARKLFLSQPAVSAAIKQLELELGLPLLIRKPGGGIELLPVGEQIFLIFRDINQLFEKIQLVKEEYHRKKKGEIIIECETIRGMHIVSSLSSRFQGTHPGIFVSVKLQTATVPRVMDGACDLIMFLTSNESPDSVNPNLEIINTWEDEHLIIVSKNHPLVGHVVSSEDLIQMSFVLASKGTAYRRTLDKVFQEQLGCCPNCTFESTDVQTLKYSVISLNKPSLVLKSSIQRELEDGTFIVLNTNLNLCCKHVLALKKHRTYSEHIELFLKFLRTCHFGLR